VQDKVNLVSIKSREIVKNLFPNDGGKVIDRLQYLCEIGVDFNRIAGHKINLHRSSGSECVSRF